MQGRQMTHFIQRLFQFMTERDRAISEHLVNINHSLESLIGVTKMEGNNIRQGMQLLVKKQDKLIDIQKAILGSKKYKQESNLPLPEIKEIQSQQNLTFTPRNHRHQSSKFGTESNRQYSTKTQSSDRFKLARKQTTKQHNHQHNRQQSTSVIKAAAELSVPTRTALVPFEQKEIIINIGKVFAEFENKDFSIKQAKNSISKWVGEVYDELSRESFNGYFSRYLSEHDMKIYFTHNLALNFQLMSEYFWEKHRGLWMEEGQHLVQHFQDQSNKVLNFLMVKYPQKQKAFISDEVRNAIPTCNRSDDPDFDVLRNTNCYFDYDETKKGYLMNVKKFLNRIITESQAHLGQFRKIMKQLFYIGEGDNKHQLKNQIGMKFKENTPLYSPSEIQANDIEIKTSEVLRIIIKWIEELERKAKGLIDGSLVHNTFLARQTNKPEYLNMYMKETLNQFMAKKQPLLRDASTEMRMRIRSTLALFPNYLNKYLKNFPSIRSTDVTSGLLSYVLAETASNLSVNYLIFLISLLEQASHIIKFGNSSQRLASDKSNNSFFDLQFVTFTISDLLRAKCTGSLAEIKQVYEKLSKHPRFTVYRVKNRTDTSNKDFLVNVRLNGTPILCEIQLAILDKAGDEKQEYLNHFSHFMYQLSRASYGPIAQAVIINSYLTDMVPFFRDQLSNISEMFQKQGPQNQQFRVQCSPDGDLRIVGYNQRNNQFSFVCNNCLSFRMAYTSHIINFDSCQSVLHQFPQQETNNQPRRLICGSCAYNRLSLQQKSLYMLKKPLSYFFKEFNTAEKESPKILCAVEKKCSVKKIWILQQTIDGPNRVYVPVFYETDTSNFRKTIKALKQNFYLYTLKDQVQFFELNTDDIVKVLQNDPNGKIILRDHIQKQPDSQSSNTQVKEEQKPEITQVLDAEKSVQIAISDKSPEFLKKLPTKNIIAITSTTSPCVLVINTVHTPEELERKTKQGRKLKEGQIRSLSQKDIWRLEKSNLDNHSFSVFKQYLPVQQAYLTHNNITDLHFIKSHSLKKLDLNCNNLKVLRLQPNDFPKLQSLQVTSNSISCIQRLRHTNLATLLLSYNNLPSLNEAAWELPSLLNLQLIGCNLIEFNLNKFKMLESFVLGENPIEKIQFPDCMPRLKNLKIFKNGIHSLDMGPSSFPSLKLLFIEQANLKNMRLPAHLKHLQSFTFMGNPHIECDFDISAQSLPELRDIQIYRNKLIKVKFSPSMKKLQKLILFRNNLRFLDLSNLNLTHLKLLDISYNPIQNIILPQKGNFSQLTTINAIYTPQNDRLLSNIPIQKGQRFPKLQQIKLGIKSLQMCLIWILRTMNLQDRQSAYQKAKQSTHRDITYIHYEDKLQWYEWKQEAMSDLMKQDTFILLETLIKMEKIPESYIKQIEDKISEERIKIEQIEKIQKQKQKQKQEESKK